jgi:hypothetical protein
MVTSSPLIALEELVITLLDEAELIIALEEEELLETLELITLDETTLLL